MEGAGDRERKLAINELMQAYEWTNQLRSHLSPCSPPEMLTQKILCSFNKVLSMLESGDSEEEPQLTDPASGNDSPHSFSRSPRSECSKRQSSKRAFGEPDCRDNSKRRKTIPIWSEQVRVGSGMSLGGPPEDGHSWRKYGQKDILGAKYPRAYYRCAHRHVKGCIALKQVQRSEEDPSIFDVCYRGNHTCTQLTTSTPGAMATSISGSNNFSVSPGHMNNYGGATMSTSGASDLTETVSAATSGSNSTPTLDLDLINADEIDDIFYFI